MFWILNIRMSSAFTSSKKTFHDNYLEYKITGDQKYKTAVDSAKQSMDSILASLQQQVTSSDKLNHNKDFSHVLRKLENENKQKHKKLIEEKDLLKEAEMRGFSDQQVPVPSSTWKYVMIGVLGGVSVLLSLM